MEAQALPRAGRLFLPRSGKVLSAFSDERLVEQVRRGNDDAFETIYDRHHSGILSFCRHMLSSPDEAEDALQQTFISAFDAIRADARDINLKPWLYTIARNRCLSILRARREQPTAMDEVPTAGLADEVQQRSDLRDLLDDLRRLPVDQRAALVLSEVGALSHSEVGAVIGCEVAKVKSLVFQARSSLIESRRAREIPCSDIREQLATATGGALRRGPLRRHLRTCVGCAEFREDVMRQRKALAAILPVLPTLGLKKSALAAVGVGGGGGAGGAAVGLTGGGIASIASSGAAVKLVGAVVVAGVAVGGGLMIDPGSPTSPAEAAGTQPGGGHAQPAPSAGIGPGARMRLIARHGAAQPKAQAKRHAQGGGGQARHTPTRGGTVTQSPSTRGGNTQHHTGHNSPGAQPAPQATSPPPAASASPAPAPAAPAPAAPAPAPPASSNSNGQGPQGNNGNHNGWDHSAHGGQGVGRGGDPPGAAPIDNGSKGNSGKKGNSGASG